MERVYLITQHFKFTKAQTVARALTPKNMATRPATDGLTL